jgi:P-type E1-E2 ATPase
VPVRCDLDPLDKARLIADRERTAGPSLMVGEGLNDAPALARASLSAALGCGAEASLETADIGLLRDDLRQVPWLLDLARRTLRVIRLNLFWAFAYNMALVPLAMAGRLQPILAALAMVASSLFVVGGSMRVGREPGRRKGSPGGAVAMPAAVAASEAG